MTPPIIQNSPCDKTRSRLRRAASICATLAFFSLVAASVSAFPAWIGLATAVLSLLFFGLAHSKTPR